MDKLEQVQERERRESEQDEDELINKSDALLSGVNPDDMEELRETYREEARGIECSTS